MAKETETVTSADIRQATIRALQRIGTANGHACPPGTFTTNEEGAVHAAMHEMFIANTMAQHAKERREQAMEQIQELTGFDKANVLAGQTVEIAQSDYYSISAKKTAPRKSYSDSRLRMAMEGHGLARSTIDAILESAGVVSNPTSIILTERM